MTILNEKRHYRSKNKNLFQRKQQKLKNYFVNFCLFNII